MDDLLKKIDGHLQDLDSSHRQSLREIDGVRANLKALQVSVDGLRVSSQHAHQAIVELRGTFASIGGILEDHERRIADLEKRIAS